MVIKEKMMSKTNPDGRPLNKHRAIREEWEQIQRDWSRILSITARIDHVANGNYLTHHFGAAREGIRWRLQQIDGLLQKCSSHFRAIRDNYSHLVLTDEEVQLLQDEWLQRTQDTRKRYKQSRKSKKQTKETTNENKETNDTSTKSTE